jgi:hypothetical protein
MLHEEQEAVPVFESFGFDFGEFAVEVRKDGKVCWFEKAANGDHVTLHPGFKSGQLDLHKTTRLPDGSTQHETLVRVSHEAIGDWMKSFVAVIAEGPKPPAPAMRPLRLGWLRHRRLLLLPMVTGPFCEKVLCKRKGRRNRWEFDDAGLQQAVEETMSARYKSDLPDGLYWVVRGKRSGPVEKGVAVKTITAYGRHSLEWMPFSTVGTLMSRVDKFMRGTFDLFRGQPKEAEVGVRSP